MVCMAIAAALGSGCGGSHSGAEPATAPPKGVSTLASDPEFKQAMQGLSKVVQDAAKPVPHRKDFKVPASRAQGKSGLDLVNVVTDPMIDALSDIDDTRELRARLNHQQYVTWILFCLAVDIDDGGLAEMYYNASGAFAAEAPALLREAGASAQARIIEQANRVFAPHGHIPVHEAERRAMTHGVDDARFAALDDRLMQLDDLDEINARYITAHRAAFFTEG
jgi:hypothetical protein